LFSPPTPLWLTVDSLIPFVETICVRCLFIVRGQHCATAHAVGWKRALDFLLSSKEVG
jgi:hypothetical protein